MAKNKEFNPYDYLMADTTFQLKCCGVYVDSFLSLDDLCHDLKEYVHDDDKVYPYSIEKIKQDGHVYEMYNGSPACESFDIDELCFYLKKFI